MSKSFIQRHTHKMKYNSTLAENHSVENTSAPKIFVEDSWMYESSRAPKNKNFQKPILWITDTATATNARALFDVVAFGDDSKIAPGDHYLILEKYTPEETIKATRWKLLAAGVECKVYSVQTSLQCLLEHESTSIQEVVLQILEFALPFDDWAARTDSLTLTTREATNIALVAIAYLKEPQKSIELATLRKRCDEAPYNWNQLMGTLEEEFQKELFRRQPEEILDGLCGDMPSSFEPDTEITQKALQVLYGDKPWICAEDKLYGWGSTYYEYSPDVVELRRISNFCNNYPVQRGNQICFPYANPACAEKILKWVKIRVGVRPELLNPPGLNCTNGVLQLLWCGLEPSWRLIDHTSDLYYTYPPIATYDPDADPKHCDRLLEALSPAQREIFLRTIAASLDLATVRKYKGRAVRALLLKGDGSNGKDSLREVVSMMFGRLGMTACTLSDFAAYDDGRKFPLSKLVRSMVNWASENTNTARLDRIQSLKAFITGDPLDAERKGVDAVEFTPSAIAIFNVNDTPNLQGTLEAITSRYGVLSFDKTFKIGADLSKGELEADPRFKYDPIFLATMVVPAFLNRVLQALVDLMRDGIDYSCTLKTLENIQAENSHLFQFCQDVGFCYNPNSTLTANEIWTVLEQWYEDNGTLDYEETSSGKSKAIWVDQANKSDKNVKAPNQVIPRFLQLFPKAKKVTIAHPTGKKSILAIQGIGFTGSFSISPDSTPISTASTTIPPQSPPQETTLNHYFHPTHPNFSSRVETVFEQVSQYEDSKEEAISTNLGCLGCDAQLSNISGVQTGVDRGVVDNLIAVQESVIDNVATPTTAIAQRTVAKPIVQGSRVKIRKGTFGSERDGLIGSVVRTKEIFDWDGRTLTKFIIWLDDANLDPKLRQVECFAGWLELL